MIRPIIAGTLWLLAGLAAAQGFPARPVTLISAAGGIPGLYASGWVGLFEPKGMRKEVVADHSRRRHQGGIESRACVRRS